MATGKDGRDQLAPSPASESMSPMADEPISLPLPSLDYLLTCSRAGLQDVELASLNLAQNCLKRARIEWNEACAHREAAGVARWLMENREALLRQSSRTLEVNLGDELPTMATIRGPKRGLDSLLGAPAKPPEEK
jgi:hypothetical protein